MIEVFKILHHMYDSSVAPELIRNTSATRGNKYKLLNHSFQVGCGEGVSPSPPGEGAVPPPQKFFEFVSENGEFWCILSGILAGVCSYKRVKR